MNPTRILTIILAAALVVGGIIYGLTRSGSGGNSPASSATSSGAPLAPGGDAVQVDFVYSPEKEQLLKPLLEEFNRSGAEVGGVPVRVHGQIVSSGEATDKIAKGSLKPTLWSPSSSFWGRIVNHRTDSDLVAEENPSLVRTPLVIAMPEPMAEALGWPKKKLGWKDITAAARNPQGWAAYGHPEWGAFKFGQTNPDFSTSGLSATVAEYLVAAGKPEGLSLADVRSPKVRNTVAAIQSSVVHYGDTTIFFAEQLRDYGVTYVSVIAMEEATVLDYNTRLRQSGPKLVAIYPTEGTFFSDNPLIIPNAPFVSAAQREGAQKLVAFLTGKVDAPTAARFGFRPADGKVRPVTPVDAAHGADPAQPTRLLSLPTPQVLNAIVEAWRADRKPARIEVVLDVSGSMADDGRLESAKQGLVSFLKILQPQDEVGLSIFNDKPQQVSEPVVMASGRQKLIQTVEDLFPDGGTAVYDATDQAAARIARSADAKHISAVVVLTDGEDNESHTSLNTLKQRLADLSGSEGAGVRVFTIAYGAGASKDVLEQIAKAGAGRAYAGDPATIERVYIQISSFF